MPTGGHAPNVIPLGAGAESTGRQDARGLMRRDPAAMSNSVAMTPIAPALVVLAITSPTTGSISLETTPRSMTDTRLTSLAQDTMTLP